MTDPGICVGRHIDGNTYITIEERIYADFSSKR